jgi:D-alanyl-D-alanine carboxypeptidase/D-alanyl-D-alanine-endopeptidase (penicillin-binding protein 4)
MVYVLTDLYREIPEERLLRLFASGGVSGTVRDWYAGDEAPYVFAKTGTLANNHCLSGYLKTRSGRLLIFSFMHNHFREPLAGIKQQMQGILEKLRDTY